MVTFVEVSASTRESLSVLWTSLSTVGLLTRPLKGGRSQVRVVRRPPVGENEFDVGFSGNVLCFHF